MWWHQVCPVGSQRSRRGIPSNSWSMIQVFLPFDPEIYICRYGHLMNTNILHLFIVNSSCKTVALHEQSGRPSVQPSINVNLHTIRFNQYIGTHAKLFKSKIENSTLIARLLKKYLNLILLHLPLLRCRQTGSSLLVIPLRQRWYVQFAHAISSFPDQEKEDGLQSV